MYFKFVLWSFLTISAISCNYAEDNCAEKRENFEEYLKCLESIRNNKGNFEWDDDNEQNAKGYKYSNKYGSSITREPSGTELRFLNDEQLPSNEDCPLKNLNNQDISPYSGSGVIRNKLSKVIDILKENIPDISLYFDTFYRKIRNFLHYICNKLFGALKNFIKNPKKWFRSLNFFNNNCPRINKTNQNPTITDDEPPPPPSPPPENNNQENYDIKISELKEKNPLLPTNNPMNLPSEFKSSEKIDRKKCNCNNHNEFDTKSKTYSLGNEGKISLKIGEFGKNEEHYDRNTDDPYEKYLSNMMGRFDDSTNSESNDEEEVSVKGDECINLKKDEKNSIQSVKKLSEMLLIRLLKKRSNKATRYYSSYNNNNKEMENNNNSATLWIDVSEILNDKDNFNITKSMLKRIEKNVLNSQKNDYKIRPVLNSILADTGMVYRVSSSDFVTKSDDAPESRIIGGQKTKIKNVPYQMAIFKNNEFLCGGALVTPSIVVTAAHCFEKKSSPNDFLVIGGVRHLQNDRGQERKMSKFITHENYFNGDWDIAIAKLNRPFDLNEQVSLVEIPPGNFCLKEGDETVVSGYGKTTWDKTITNKELHVITLRLTNQERCKDRKLKTIQDALITNKQICTEAFIDKGTCYGDSGGPMVRDGYLVGVVSWGSPCAVGDPDVFTNIVYYYDWLKDKITKLSYE